MAQELLLATDGVQNLAGGANGHPLINWIEHR